MRKCLRCGSQMIEDCGIKTEWGGYGITLTDDECKRFFGRLGAPKVAICPECGEISLYIDDKDKLDKLRENNR